MALSDLLSDVLTRIRNGQLANHSFVVAPSSNLVKAVLDVMKKEGYITSYEEFEKNKGIRSVKIDLKYFDNQSVIKVIERVSKPGRRVYTKKIDMKKCYNGLGTSILSTSQGVMSDSEARSHNVGGEVLCNIY